eukprot:m.15855 g.15855  ORF g.15855 m.15855 type:complete len:865 (+) comp6806_c0_seq1:232-2826(+)
MHPTVMGRGDLSPTCKGACSRFLIHTTSVFSTTMRAPTRQLSALCLALCFLMLCMTPPAHAKVKLRIGRISIRSFYGNVHSSGLLSDVAVRTMVSYFTAKTNVEIEMVYREGSYTDQESVDARCARVAQELVDESVVAVIGPPSSSCSIPSALVLGANGVPQISPSATSATLSDKELFPTFFRITPSDAVQGTILAKIVQQCKWSSIGVLASDDVWAVGLKDRVKDLLESSSPPVEFSNFEFPVGMPYEDLFPGVQDYMSRTNTSVHIIICYRTDLSNLLSALTELAVTGPEWTWLGVDAVADSADVKDFAPFQGMVATRPFARFGPILEDFNQFPDSYAYPELVRDVGNQYPYIARMFDEIHVLLSAALKLNASGKWTNDPILDRPLLLETLRTFNSTETGIAGASARSVFFNEFQDGVSEYEIVNLIDGRFVQATPTVFNIENNSSWVDANVTWSDPTNTTLNGFHVCPPSLKTSVIGTDDATGRLRGVVAAISIVSVVLVLVLLFAIYYQHKARSQFYDFSDELHKVPHIQKTPIKPRELDRAWVQPGHAPYVQGGFACIYKGTIDATKLVDVVVPPSAFDNKEDQRLHVALKTPLKTASEESTKQFLQEAAFMAQIPHHQNIVAFYGVVTAGTPLFLVMEWCEHSSLNVYLQSQMDFADTVKLKILQDVAGAMMFLHQQSILHCDLAARNVLMDSTFVCKLSDFGMARHFSHNAMSEVELPVKWCAPEVLTKRIFLPASDVWSFGILAVEVFTRGAEPWPLKTTETVRLMLLCGDSIHPKLPSIDEDIYELLLTTWQEEPSDRLGFDTLYDLLETLIAAKAASRMPSARHSRSHILSSLSRGTTPRSISPAPYYPSTVTV